MLHPAVFFDRDGTLVVDRGYMSSPDQVELWEGAAATLQQLHSEGYLLVVITNQSGIGRGLVTENEAELVAKRFYDLLAEQGVLLDGVYFCPHAPEADCLCRKPRPGLLHQAAAELGIDFDHSYMVGDKETDCEVGKAVGCQSILFAPTSETGSAQKSGKWPVARNFSEVLRMIREGDKSGII